LRRPRSRRLDQPQCFHQLGLIGQGLGFTFPRHASSGKGGGSSTFATVFLVTNGRRHHLTNVWSSRVSARLTAFASNRKDVGELGACGSDLGHHDDILQCHRWNTTLESRTRRMTPKRKRKLTLVVVEGHERSVCLKDDDGDEVLDLMLCVRGNEDGLHANRIRQREMDEFRSSVTCSKCYTRLTNMRASTTQWNMTSKKIETRVHKVLHCSSRWHTGARATRRPAPAAGPRIDCTNVRDRETVDCNCWLTVIVVRRLG
jgi:hypothetical protein